MSTVLQAVIEPAPAEPLPGRSTPSPASLRSRIVSAMATSGGLLCACTFGASGSAGEARASSIGRNFIQVVASKPAARERNFVVIGSNQASASATGPTAPAPSEPAFQPPSERVVLDDAKLAEFATDKNLPLKPFYVHVSQRPARLGHAAERATVVGARAGEVWRYELSGHARKVSRIGVVATPTDRERAEHESAVVGSRVHFAYRPAKDSPSGEAPPDADAPLSVYVRTPDALFQVSRSGPDAFTITQVGVFDADAP